MPSSYSANLLLELMADGENEGLWGDITNENLEILGRAAGGVGGIALAGTTHTLTVAQGALSEGQYSTLVLGGSPTGTNTITIQPNTVTRTYLVQNSSGQDAVFTQGSGGNVTVPNGGTAIVFCSGTGASSSVTDITADFVRTSVLDDYALLSELSNYALLSALDDYALLTTLDDYALLTTLDDYALLSALDNYVSKAANGVVTFEAGVNEAFASVMSSGGGVTIDCRVGTVFSHALTENTVFTFSDPPASGTAYGFTLKTTQDSVARTVTWPASVDWAGSEAPVLSEDAGAVDVFVFFTHDGGLTWYGFTSGKNLS